MNIEHEYEYKPKLTTVLLGIGFFGLCAVISVIAAYDNHELMINGIIHLSVYQASVFWWIICSISLCFVLAASLMIVQRFKFKQRIALTSSSLIVPKSRWSESEDIIDYRAIKSLSSEKIQGQRLLHVFHSEGKYTIAASMLSSKAVYDNLCDLLVEKTQLKVG